MSTTTNVRHLPRAPISEAILDVQVEARDELRLSDLEDLAEQRSREFPVMEGRHRPEATFGTSPQGPVQTSARDLGPDGYLLRTTDRKDVVQLRIGGFTINRLAPYQGWEAWFPTFRRLWGLYVDVAKPIRAVRISARCINVIPLASESRLHDYLVNPPEPPESLPSRIKSFVWRVELTEGGEPERLLTLVQLLQSAPGTGASQLVFDIDAACLGDLPLDDVVAQFDSLHTLRNEAFFSSLTRTALGEFE